VPGYILAEIEEALEESDIPYKADIVDFSLVSSDFKKVALLELKIINKMTKLENLIKDLNKANKRLKEATSLKPTDIHKDATIQRFELPLSLAGSLFRNILGTKVLTVKVQRVVLEKGRDWT